MSICHLHVEVRENSRPRLFMRIPRFLVQKARLGESLSRSSPLWCRLARHYVFVSLRSCLPCEPCKLDKLVALKKGKRSISRIAISFTMYLPKEDGVDFALHQQRSRRRKPAIELLCPCSIEDVRRCIHYALDSEAKRT